MACFHSLCLFFITVTLRLLSKFKRKPISLFELKFTPLSMVSLRSDHPRWYYLSRALEDNNGDFRNLVPRGCVPFGQHRWTCGLRWPKTRAGPGDEIWYSAFHLAFHILPFALVKSHTAGPDDPCRPVLPCTPYKHKKTVSLLYRGERK